MNNEVTPEYIKRMLELYRGKNCNEFTDEELKKLERFMCNCVEKKDE